MKFAGVISGLTCGRSMGRPGLTSNKKFRRLSLILGSEASSRGHLELMWDSAYESGDEILGDRVDVELAARWTGERGKLTDALVETGFIEMSDGIYKIHDFWHHAPAYVRKRRTREDERRSKVDPCFTVASSMTSQCLVNDQKTAPLPHPHPHPHPKRKNPPNPPRGERKVKVDPLSQTASQGLLDAVSKIVDLTPQSDSDGRTIRVVRGEVLSRMETILTEHPSSTPEILSESWVDYLRSSPKRIKAPQYFFGKQKDQGEKGANWYPWAKAIFIRNQSKVVNE